jgi:hypothetical protein
MAGGDVLHWATACADVAANKKQVFVNRGCTLMHADILGIM